MKNNEKDSNITMKLDYYEVKKKDEVKSIRDDSWRQKSNEIKSYLSSSCCDASRYLPKPTHLNMVHI